MTSLRNVFFFYCYRSYRFSILVCFITAFFFNPPQYYSQQKRIALVIGNSNYKVLPLKNPVHDALLMKSTFENLGFEVILDTNIQKRERFLNTIRNFGEKAEKYDVAFVYYAGHGVQIEGVNYLLATNESYKTIGEVKDFGIEVNRILDYLETASNKINVLILDACRNNPFEQNWSTKTRAIDGGSGLAGMSSSGALIAFATSAGSTAGDGQGKNSIYCTSLSKNLLIENTSVDQIFRNVRSEVRKLSGDKQRPTIDNQLEGEAFYLKKSDYLEKTKLIDSLIDANNYTLASEEVNIILSHEPSSKQALLRRGRIKYNTENSYYDGSDILKAIKLFPNDPEVYIYMARYYGVLKKNDEALLQLELACKLDTSNADVYNEKARIYEDLANKDEALNNYTKAIELDKTNAAKYYNRGFFFIRQQDFNNALIDFTKAIELAPANIGYLYYRGDLYQTYLHDTKKALADFEQVLKIKPDYIYAINGIGVIYENQGDLESAIKQYDKGIALEKINPEAAAYCYGNRAQIYEKQNKAQQALSDFSKAIELDKTNPNRYYNRGFFYQRQQDFNNALIDYTKAIELAPADIYYLYGRGNLYQTYLHDTKKALADFEQILKIKPDYIYAINGIGVIYENQGDLESAIKQYEKGIALEKINPEAAAYCYGNRAQIYEKQNKAQQALSDFTKAIELDKTNAARYYTRAIFFDRQKDFNNALVDYTKAIELEPANIDYLYLRGGLYEDYLHDTKKALADYEQVLKIQPDDIDAIDQIGVIYENQGDLESAIKQFEKGIALEKINPEAAAYCYVNRAQIYEKQNKAQQALSDFTKAIELDKTNAVRYYNRGFFYQRQQDFNNALIDYTKAIELAPADIDYLYGRGGLYEDYLHDTKKALADYEQVLKIQPDDINAINRIGLIYENQGDLESAIKQYEKGIALEKINPEAAAYCYVNRAQIYEKQNKAQQALSDFSKAIELDKTNPNRYYNRGFFYQRQQDFNNALIDYTKAIELAPADIDYLYGRGGLYEDYLHDTKKALADYEQVLKIQPDDIDAISEIGVIYENQGDLESAIKQYDKGIALEKINPEAAAYCYGNRAVLYEKQNKAQQALSDFTKAIELDKTNAARYYTRGYFYLRILGDKYAALEDYSLALKLDSLSIYILFNRGSLFSDELNDHREAIKDFEKIIKIDSNDVTALNWIGVFYARLNDRENANKYYLRTISKINIGFADTAYSFRNGIAWAFNNLAETFQIEKNNSNALEYYTKAIKFDSLNPVRYYYRGWLLSEFMKKHKEALSDLNKAIELENNNPKWYLMRAIIFERNGENKKAELDYNKAIKLSNNSAFYLSERGRFYLNLNQIEKSNIDINTAMKLDSNLKRALYYKSDLLIKQNKQDEAIILLKQLCEKFENDTISNKLLGDIYFSNKSYHKALNYYIKASNAISGNKEYMTVEPNMCIVFASDLYFRIAEIYKIFNEFDLMCDNLNNAKKTLKNELRPDKDKIEDKIESSNLNCSNGK